MGSQSAELRESWQRGPNENTNCLLRQYFSTRTDFLRCSRTHLNNAAHHVNERPRKALEFETRRSGVTAVLRRPVEIAQCSLSLGPKVCCYSEHQRFRSGYSVFEPQTRSEP